MKDLIKYQEALNGLIITDFKSPLFFGIISNNMDYPFITDCKIINKDLKPYGYKIIVKKQNTLIMLSKIKKVKL